MPPQGHILNGQQPGHGVKLDFFEKTDSSKKSKVFKTIRNFAIIANL
jgi:hypothetical protein